MKKTIVKKETTDKMFKASWSLMKVGIALTLLPFLILFVIFLVGLAVAVISAMV